MIPRTFRTTLTLLAASCLLVALTAATGALAMAGQPAAFWLPRDIAPERVASAPELYFEGLSGSVVGVADTDAPSVLAAGGRSVALAPGETLYAFLVEDAGRAFFEVPSRVLVRSGHEVFVATPGDVPRLTAESDGALAGLKQPVRIDFIPRPRAGSQVEPAAPTRVVDPLVAAMVSEVSTATYQPTWQALDDFETREVFQANNLAASQWILEKFQSFGLSAAFHYYTQSGQKRNVIATLPGQVDPTKVVYICGHFDSTSPTPASCAPGADDNATGTNAVIETARILSQYLFQYTIKFACFNGEEQGLVGSAAYAAAMASAGENIIAVYNCDMIGYRGTDPAPADLVIYTDTNSQPIAAILADAINTYVPGEIQPVVTVEALTGSDHASFWNHGYKAVCAIEDEAWGADFCPWYHTCNDRIEQYPQDYAVSCTKANLAAVAVTALPINPQTSYLVLGSTVLDDDLVGGSSGNGDGIANPGETIELWATIRNVGAQTATGVSGTLTTTTPGVTILNATAPWANIPAGGQGTNTTALRFQVGSAIADGSVINFTLTMTDASGSRPISLQYTAAAPALAHYWHRVADVETGNGNGIIDAGEVVSVPVILINHGGQPAASVTAEVTSESPHLSVVAGTATVAAVPSGGTGELGPGFRLAASMDAVPGEVLSASLTISTASGYQTTSNFKIKVGTAVYDECEAEAPWSLFTTGDNATTGLWVRDDPNGTTYGTPPAQVQPEDDHTAAPGTDCYFTGQGSVGGAAGEADLDGGKTTLTTPLLDLSQVTDARVTYWRWYTNNLGNSPNLDPWIVQISNNGGTSWVDLENTTASANTWTQESLLISDFVTPTAQMLVRFVANDISPNSLLEAAVDDFEISGTPGTVAVDDAAVTRILRLDLPRPNPAAGPATIRFALPEAGPVSLQLFGIDGRLVRSLWSGQRSAGEQEIAWDGRSGSGQSVAPGVYFFRLQAGTHVLSRRMVVAP